MGVRWEQHWDVNSGVRGQGPIFVVVVISFLIEMTDDCSCAA